MTSEADIVTLRLATPEDAPFIERMGYLAGYPDGSALSHDEAIQEEWLQPYIREWGQQEGDFGLVAEDDSGQPIGAAWYRRYPENANNGVPLHELSIAVEPAAQGKKVGRTLLSALMTHAAKEGIDELGLQVQTDNSRAISLYKGLGFGAIVRSGKDQHIMTVRLSAEQLPIVDYANNQTLQRQIDLSTMEARLSDSTLSLNERYQLRMEAATEAARMGSVEKMYELLDPRSNGRFFKVNELEAIRAPGPRAIILAEAVKAGHAECYKEMVKNAKKAVGTPDQKLDAYLAAAEAGWPEGITRAKEILNRYPRFQTSMISRAQHHPINVSDAERQAAEKRIAQIADSHN